MLEPEMAFANLDTVLDISEEMIKSTVNHLLQHSKEDIEFFTKRIDKNLSSRLETIVSKPFVRITYTEAIELLLKSNKKDFAYPVTWGLNLQKEHEKWLSETAFNSTPVFVTNYPKEIKPFYMKENPDGKTVAAVDLLVDTLLNLFLYSTN